MTIRVLSVLAIASALLSASCTLNSTEPPALTGPSEFANAVTISANPDTIALGQSGTTAGQQSLIVVTTFDANGQPKGNQQVRIDTLVNGKVSDCGRLGARILVTGSDGRASTVFTAPGTPPNCASFNADGTVTIQATPVGTDFQSTGFTARNVNVFMALPVANSGGPFTVSFSIAPNPAKVGDLITFSDAGSVSPGHTIVSYRWTFSDGHVESGASINHDFGSAGTYTVTLTATDDIGQTSFKTALVTITS